MLLAPWNLTLYGNKVEDQIMAYIENRMCNLQLWESIQEEVVC